MRATNERPGKTTNAAPRTRVPHVSSVVLSTSMIAAAALLLAARPAAAQQNAPAAYTSGPQAEPRPPRPMLGFSVSLGTRSDLVRSAALDPFSRTDRLSQPALGLGYRFGAPEAPGLALAFEWNRGTTSATARAASTDLTTDRLAVGVEARFPVLNRLAVFGRLAPGVVRVKARMYDASAPAPAYQQAGAGTLGQTTWAPAVDVGAGLAFRIADVHGPGTPSFSFWVLADGGYGWSAAHQVLLRPSSEPQPGRVDEPVRLGELALRGAFARARLALSF